MSGDAYRNDRSALQERANQLRARIAELQALGSEREQAARELAAVEKSLGDMHQRSLPLLDRVTVASPCSVPWSEMKGDDRVRFCGHCSKNVFNLSALSRDEATAFVSSVEGAACVRFYRRADGTMLTADCPVGVRRRRQRRILGMAVGAVAALGVGTAAFAYTSNLRTTRAHTMGAIAGEMSVPEMQELAPPKAEDSAQRKEPSSPVPVQPEKKPTTR